MSSTHAPSSLPGVRCLVLDNYDSYTMNLVHALGELSGCTPVVAFNTISPTELERLLREHHIDCVVVSPGPGHPGRADDFGVCSLVYAPTFDTPVLGVCLGLQGQASCAGGLIVPAHEPRHGRLSALAHDGKGLFAGLEQGVEVVRYNSLVVRADSLPAHLEVSAWAEWEEPAPGLPREVMALRHVEVAPLSSRVPLLRESVQFHPESICSHPGRRMMQNWFDMVVNRKRALEASGHAVHWHVRDIHPEAPVASLPAAAPHPFQPKPYVLLAQKLSFAIDSERAFLTLHAPPSDATASSAAPSSTFWLDSSRVEAGRSRFSFMGDNAGPLSYSLWYDVRDPLRVHSRRGAHRSEERLEHGEQIWKLLERQLEERACDVHIFEPHAQPAAILAAAAAQPPHGHTLPFSFEGGFVGYIGYAMRRMCTPDSLPPMHLDLDRGRTLSPDAASPGSAASEDEFRVPDLAFLFADRTLVFDHQERECYCLALCARDPSSSAQPPAASIQAGLEWIDETRAKLKHVLTLEAASSASATSAAIAPSSPPPSPALSPALPPPSVSVLPPSWFQSESEYLRAISHCLDAIRAGESYEVCLTNQLHMRVEVRHEAGAEARVHSSLRPLDYYRVLRRVNPAAYAAFFQLAYDDFSLPGSSSLVPSSSRPASANTSSWSICCSSPERFMQVSRERVAESKPIKGTAARGATPKEDAAAVARLQASRKDFAENLMIVDLLRHDLSRACSIASVCVPKLMEVETYATVHNLVSTVQGRLRPDATTFDLLQAAFPPGSMTGAPKLRTCQILAQLECEPDSTQHAAAAASHASPGAHSPAPPVRTRERGIYSGNIGWIGLNGGMSDLNVVIRTAVVHESRREERTVATAEAPASGASVYTTHLSIGAGGAIVHMSDPAEEYAEILLKTKALVQALHLAAKEMADTITPQR